MREHRETRERRRTSYTHLSIGDRDWQAAFDVQEELARTGRHRAVGIADLLNSVLAIRYGLTMIHYDSDFETVADVTGLVHRWVSPRGSLA